MGRSAVCAPFQWTVLGQWWSTLNKSTVARQTLNSSKTTRCTRPVKECLVFLLTSNKYLAKPEYVRPVWPSWFANQVCCWENQLICVEWITVSFGPRGPLDGLCPLSEQKTPQQMLNTSRRHMTAWVQLVFPASPEQSFGHFLHVSQRALRGVPASSPLHRQTPASAVGAHHLGEGLPGAWAPPLWDAGRCQHVPAYLPLSDAQGEGNHWRLNHGQTLEWFQRKNCPRLLFKLHLSQPPLSVLDVGGRVKARSPWACDTVHGGIESSYE